MQNGQHNMKNLIEGVVLVQGKGQDASLPKAIPIRAALASFAKTIGFDNYSVAIQSEEEGTQTDPAIVLSNLNLIDTSHAEWNQIMEIRKDGDSKKKLMHVPAHSDHPFRFNPISDFGLIRSLISALSDQK